MQEALVFTNIGQVVKVLWPGVGGSELTDVTQDLRSPENTFCKIRWFIVVKEGKHFSTCVYYRLDSPSCGIY